MMNRVYLKPPLSLDFTKLLVVGGNFDSSKTEVIDLSGNGSTCTAKSDYPYQFQDGSGFSIEGKPTNCGGRASMIHNACDQYDLETDSWVQVRINLMEQKQNCSMPGACWDRVVVILV